MANIQIERDEWTSVFTFLMFILVQPLAPVLYELVDVIFPRDISKKGSGNTTTSKTKHNGVTSSDFLTGFKQVRKRSLLLVPKVVFMVLLVLAQMIYLAGIWLFTRFATDEVALYNSFWVVIVVIWPMDFFWLFVYFKQRYTITGFIMLCVKLLASIYLTIVAGINAYDRNHSSNDKEVVLIVGFYILIPYVLWNLYLTIALSAVPLSNVLKTKSTKGRRKQHTAMNS